MARRGVILERRPAPPRRPWPAPARCTTTLRIHRGCEHGIWTIARRRAAASRRHPSLAPPTARLPSSRLHGRCARGRFSRMVARRGESRRRSRGDPIQPDLRPPGRRSALAHNVRAIGTTVVVLFGGASDGCRRDAGARRLAIVQAIPCSAPSVDTQRCRTSCWRWPWAAWRCRPSFEDSRSSSP